jgi:hypothetical protein
MNTEELYKLKASVKKELKPVVDELITLRELRERIEYENKELKIRIVMQDEHIRSLKQALNVIGGVYEKGNI